LGFGDPPFGCDKEHGYPKPRECKELEEVAMPTREQLIGMQMQLYPQSIIITPQDVIEWCDSGDTMKRREIRYRLVTLAIQYDVCVWYRFPDHEVTGCRYGLDGPDYISNFSCV